MPHFSEEVFADVVRGIDVPAHKELQSHAANGCSQCAQGIKLWSQLQAIGARENTYCPPADSVRMVKLEFVAMRLKENETLGKIVFDSFSQPALAGVRSGSAAAARQMVFEADGMMVDLRFDRPARSTCVSLIGQVLNQKAPRGSLANVAVMLWTEKGLVLAETTTNPLGEFHLEFEPQMRLRLSIEGVAGRVIRIPLSNLSADREKDGITEGIRGGYC